MTEARRTLAIVAIVLGALLLRASLITPRFHQPPDDPDRYLPLARTIAAGEGLATEGNPTAYRPPLYPILLAPFVRFIDNVALTRAIGGLHLLLGAGTVGLSIEAARRLGLSTARQLFAGVIVAFDPVLVVQCRSVMTETLAAFLAAVVLVLAVNPRSRGGFPLGFAGGLAILCRPSIAPALALTGFGMLRSCPFKRTLTFVLGVLLTLSPWILRNWVTLGAPVWATTHGGYTLALANNDAYYDEVVLGPPGAVWGGPNQQRWFETITVATRELGEPGADQWLGREAIRTIQRRPGTFLKAMAARLVRLWGLSPSAAVYPEPVRWLCLIWTLPLWVLVGWSLARRTAWSWPLFCATAQILGLTFVHAFYWTDLRMRAPVVPALALLAAHAGLIPRASSATQAGTNGSHKAHATNRT